MVGVGPLAIQTAILYAELNEETDGASISIPPSIRVGVGLVQHGMACPLAKALYGLRVAPKRWGEKKGQHPSTYKIHTR